MVFLDYIEFGTEGRNDIIDLTETITSVVSAAKLKNGHVLIFVPGATGALSTIEYEPGLVVDLPLLMERLIPEKSLYHHNERWHDGNGHSHLRATLIGPSLTIPLTDGRLILGTWQQIIFIEFDNKPHRRKLPIQIVGE